jgi:hypothetical protein
MRTKTEGGKMKEELPGVNHHAFILHPSAFSLALSAPFVSGLD